MVVVVVVAIVVVGGGGVVNVAGAFGAGCVVDDATREGVSPVWRGFLSGTDSPDSNPDVPEPEPWSAMLWLLHKKRQHTTAANAGSMPDSAEVVRIAAEFWTQRLSKIRCSDIYCMIYKLT